METKVRLAIISRMTDPDGDVHEIKNARRGTLVRTAQGVKIDFDDEQDGERAHIELTCEGKNARMRRMGMTSAALSFVPGERTSGAYVTPYGEIPVAVSTSDVTLSDEGVSGMLELVYDVYMGGERTSGTRYQIRWRA